MVDGEFVVMGFSAWLAVALLLWREVRAFQRDFCSDITHLRFDVRTLVRRDAEQFRHETDRPFAYGLRHSDLAKMAIGALESEEGDVTVVVAAGYDVHAVWDDWTDQQRALATLHARAVNSGVEDPGATPDFLEPCIREETPRDSDAGTKADVWNTCAKCGQLVDCDDVHDGSEVACTACGAVNFVVEAGDGSFYLDWDARDSDTETEA